MVRSFKMLGHRIPERGEKVTMENSYGKTFTFEVVYLNTHYMRSGEVCRIKVRCPTDGTQTYTEFHKFWDEACRDHQSF